MLLIDLSLSRYLASHCPVSPALHKQYSRRRHFSLEYRAYFMVDVGVRWLPKYLLRYQIKAGSEDMV